VRGEGVQVGTKPEVEGTKLQRDPVAGQLFTEFPAI